MRVERPWGWYEELLSGEGYLVKRLLVRAGRQLSLQLHHHRSESWTVVAGDGYLVSRPLDGRGTGRPPGGPEPPRARPPPVSHDSRDTEHSRVTPLFCHNTPPSRLTDR